MPQYVQISYTSYRPSCTPVMRYRPPTYFGGTRSYSTTISFKRY